MLDGDVLGSMVGITHLVQSESFDSFLARSKTLDRLKKDAWVRKEDQEIQRGDSGLVERHGNRWLYGKNGFTARASHKQGYVCIGREPEPSPCKSQTSESQPLLSIEPGNGTQGILGLS